MVDPIKLEVFKNLFTGVAEEMGGVLCRTSFSPNIKERRDYSCAIFDSSGDMIAQAAHIPVHLGSMPLSVKSVIEKCSVQRGDAVMLNDPFEGGTHLPDITIVSPVFGGDSGKPRFFVANRAHHADVGGSAAGSMPLCTEVYGEGLRIPPVKIVNGGEIDSGLLRLILANVRTPQEREGDLTAQLSANNIGERRLVEIANRYSWQEVHTASEQLRIYAEKVMRQAIKQIPDAEYSYQDFMDNDGITNEPLRIRVVISINDADATIDFTGSSEQTAGNVNAVYAVTLSAVCYVFRCIVPFDIPLNAGCLAPLKLIAPEGTIVNARCPAAVAGGNVETSQRIVDVIFGALSKAIPERIPAASQGTMNNLAVGGYDAVKGRPFTYYETIGGGSGAGPGFDGVHGVHTHMTNTMNTPVEAVETAYPLRVRRYCLRRDSGGDGEFKGGDGIIREVELLCGAQVTVLSERRSFAPPGRNGGGNGKPGKNSLIRAGNEDILSSKFSIPVKTNDIIRIETPGGGGHGPKSSD